MSKPSFRQDRTIHPLRSVPGFKVRTLALLTGGVICAALLPPNSYAELPDPCRGGCGPSGNLSFVQAGAATYNTSNNTMTVNQTSDKAVLNWNAFNVSQDATVNFAQKNASSVALNRVFGSTPSKILGKVNANGQIYLINPSGILFGRTAKVNVGGLVASTLNVDTDTFMNSGIANALEKKDLSNRVAKDDYAAFRNKEGEWGEHDASQKVVVEEGASIKTNGAGNVILVGKSVENNGNIEANDGQVLLVAAEDRVYLQPSEDLALRGFLVEVETGGEVTNNGEVKAERGNVTLAGHAVNQHGVVKATTSIDRNGSIYLQARDGGDVIAESGDKKNTLTASRGGSLSVGESSLTSIELELNSLDKAIDEQKQLKSQVKLAGQTVHIKQNATIKAHNGVVDVVANSTPDKSLTSGTGNIATRDDRAYIQVDSGASIDVQGADATLEMSRNFVTLELFSSELKDSPLQRNGVLRGQEITVDIRKGTPLADISAAVAAIPKTLAERASEGGSVNLVSQGAVVLNQDSKIDISGGEITYESGFVSTTKLVSDGRVIDIADADPNLIYDGILGVNASIDGRSGAIYREGRPVAQAFRESGYTAGSDAGTVNIAGYNMHLEGDVVSDVVTGRYQSKPENRPTGGTLNIGLPRDIRGFIDNVAPSIVLDSGRTGQQAADTQLASIELAFRQELEQRLRAENAAISEEELANAVRDELNDATVLDQLRVKFRAAFDKDNKAFINIDKLADSGLQSVNINSNGAVTVQTSENPLQLADGASLSITGERVSIDRSIVGAGASLAFQSQANIKESVRLPDIEGATQGIALADDVTLDVSGEYVNDVDMIGLPPRRSIQIDAGTISLAVSGNEVLSFGDNNQLLADGGAYVSRKGKVKAGKAGSISLDASAFDAAYAFSGAPMSNDTSLSTSDGLVLSARGLADNGTLTIAAEGFKISDTVQTKLNDVGVAQDISSEDSTGWLSRSDQGIKGNQLNLSSEFFEDGAFGDYRLKATRGDVIIDSGTQIDLVQRNLVLLEESIDTPTAQNLHEISDVTTLDARLRNAVDFSIAQKTNFDADLIVGTGASVVTEAGGRLSFANGSRAGGARILVDGLLQADAGQISMKLTREDGTAAVNDRSMIWVGDNADIISRGYFDEDYNENAPDTLLGQLVTGEVLDGGSVSMSATGYIVLQEGAVVDVSGSSGEIDFLAGFGVGDRATYVRQQVQGGAGQVKLTSGEGMVLAGEFRADSAGIGASQQQSALTIQSTFGDCSVEANGGTDPTLIDPARHILIVSHQEAVVPAGVITTLAEGESSYFRSGDQAIAVGSMASGMRGHTVLNSGMINESFDNLSIKTDGVVSFGDSQNAALPVDLNLDHSLKIDSKYLRVNGGADAAQQVALNAHLVEIGSPNTPQGVGINLTGNPQSGESSLTINASAIDIRNSLYVDGIRSLALNADGDIRLRDIGTLTTTGELALSARQVVATTMSDMKLQALDIVSNGEVIQSGKITLNGNGETAVPVLAAQGKVTLAAAEIEQNGTLLAPFGAITLDAVHLQANGANVVRGETGSLTLGSNSITSVSLNGQTVPFGNTLNGLEWIYGTNNTKIFTDSERNIVTPGVALQGDQVDIATGATVDVSGSGDLMAYEYVSGLGGSKDYLDMEANGADAGVIRYAIIPKLGNASLPFDQKFNTSDAPAVGSTITLGAGSALPAGEYLLLPAQYALLPGAFIIEQVQGYRDVASRNNFKLLDGTPIVAGTIGVSGLDTLATHVDGYSVRAGSDARQFSEYRETSANAFFKERAGQLDLALVPARPLDAALVSINAGSALNLQGTISGAAGEGGRASALDISADRMQIVAPGSAAEATDGIVLGADQLANLNVGSLLLGGRRTISENGISIDVLANEVSIAEGVQVTGSEVILTAADSVTVKQGAALTSNAAASNEHASFTINNGGAVVAVSQRFVDSINRTGNTGGASIHVDENARVAAGSSVVLDSTGSTVLAGSVSAPGALHLGAAGVELGRTSGEGLVLDQTALASLAGVDLLGIQANEQMTVADGVTLNAENLRITTPLLQGVMGAGGQANINADKVTLAGGSQASAGSSGEGRLNINTGTLTLSGGNLAVAGLNVLDVNAQKALVFAGDGATQLSVDQTLIKTPLVYGNDGVTATLATTGDLSFIANGNADDTAGGIGAKINVEAASLQVDNTWRVESGVVGLKATGNLTLGSQARVDASGRTFSVYETSLYSDGGHVQLSADQGNLDIQNGATIDISAQNGGGDAGSLLLGAVSGDINMAGSLLATAAKGEAGRLQIDAQRYVGGLDGIADLTQASGAKGALDVRLRGGEEQLLSAGKVLQGQRIDLAFDNAGVILQGELNASGERGGVISVQANGGVDLQDGSRLLARGTSDRGGSVLVSAHNGELTFASGSTIDVSGREGGEVVLRADIDSSRGVNIDDNGFAGTIVGARRARLEVHDTPYLDSDSFEQEDAIAIRERTVAIQANAGVIRDRLGIEPAIDLASSLEIIADGDYTWKQEVNLDEWQVYSEDGSLTSESVLPGTLTVRASGMLHMEKGLQDGFVTKWKDVDGELVPVQVLSDKNSWSFRLTAGADLSAANALETRTGIAADFIVGNDVKIRTGNGSIDVAAAQDFKLSNSGSALYSSGRDIGLSLDRYDESALIPTPSGEWMVPGEGGDVSISVGKDVIGQENTRSVTPWTAWLVDRTAYAGEFVPDENGDPVIDPVTGELQYLLPREDAGRYIDFHAYSDGVAAFGGGNVDIDAGGKVLRLGIALPSAAHIDSESGQLTEIGSGNLRLHAAGDIISSNILLANGTGKITSESSIKADRILSRNFAGFSALWGGQLHYVARKDLTLLGAFDAASVARTISGTGNTFDGYYFSFDDDTAFSATSIAGNAVFETESLEIQNLFGATLFASSEVSQNLLVPKDFVLSSFAGDLTVDTIASFAQNDSRLILWADRNLTLNGSTSELIDLPLADLSRITDPLAKDSNFDPLKGVSERPVSLLENQQAEISMIARSGDFHVSNEFTSAVPITVYAGHDIAGVKFNLTHYDESDVSRLTAGRDFVLQSGTDIVRVEGPGRLEIMAGRNIDLGTSVGIETVGSKRNVKLQGRSGADVFMFAGVSVDDIQYDSFIAPLLANNTQLNTFATELQSYVNSVTKENLSQRDAAERFRSLTSEQQIAFKSSVADSEEQLASMLTAMAFSDAMSDTISYSAAYLPLLAKLQSTTVGMEALATSYRLHESSTANSSDVAGLLSAVPQKQQQEVIHYGLALLDENSRRDLIVNTFSEMSESDRRPLVTHAFFNELKMSGRNANAAAVAGYDRGYQAIESFFATAKYEGDKTLTSTANGNVSLLLSKVYTLDDGDINLIVPGGFINAGVVNPPLGGVPKKESELGIVVQGEGAINAYMQNDLLVNQSRVFTLKEGPISMWSSAGNIDAGRGAKTAVSAPAPTVTFDEQGNVTIEVGETIAGKGIRQIDTTGEDSAFDVAFKKTIPVPSVDLVAPIGEINAGDAGIGASGNINIAAARVVGADNIDIGGVAVGVPVADTSGFSGGFTGADSASTAVSNASEDAADASDSPAADDALAWLEVTFAGFGDEVPATDGAGSDSTRPASSDEEKRRKGNG